MPKKCLPELFSFGIYKGLWRANNEVLSCSFSFKKLFEEEPEDLDCSEKDPFNDCLRQNSRVAKL